MKVYLAGPINGCTDDESRNWREDVKLFLGEENCIDPFRRDYRGREADNVQEIVELDKRDIREATTVLANCWQPSAGTSMEILYAWAGSVKVVAIVPPNARVSPWIQYHSDYVARSLEDALAKVEEYESAR